MSSLLSKNQPKMGKMKCSHKKMPHHIWIFDFEGFILLFRNRQMTMKIESEIIQCTNFLLPLSITVSTSFVRKTKNSISGYFLMFNYNGKRLITISSWLNRRWIEPNYLKQSCWFENEELQLQVIYSWSHDIVNANNVVGTNKRPSHYST